MKVLSLAYSTCPNDTFIFHALTHHLINTPHTYQTHLHDVETLNQYALKQRFDVTKLSFHALAHVLPSYCLLRSGSALGRGCGPLIVAREKIKPAELQNKTIAVPGRLTTASLLLKLFNPEVKTCNMPFEQIMPAVAEGRVDAGVIIHEARFTYPLYKLKLITDLGEWWEEETGTLIPLGCIAAKRSLGENTIKIVEHAIRESIEYAENHPQASRRYIKQHACEMSEEVMEAHIKLYVNKYTRDIGERGMASIATLFELAEERRIIPETHTPLFEE
jgi:1,4-dihydroxy-6-naphthoate synthase